ncbi:MAG: ATP-binding protein [Neisseriales bacterium]|nr:MAG: ATP-binding protein [Neisseriales bacterium]
MLLQDIFINRKKELAEISSGIALGQSFIIIAPRRYGKTTLIKKIAKDIESQNQVIYIDVMRYAHSAISLAEAITEACLAKIGIIGKLRNWLKNIDAKLDLKIKFQELEVDIILEQIAANDGYNALAKSLELAEKLALKQNQRWVMIYDEIGELQHLDEQAIRVMRSVIQHHQQVSYLFAGSQESLMNNIFISSRGAFYRFGIIYQLTELELKDVVEFFHSSLSNVSGEVIDFIIDNFHGHPYYTTNIFYRIIQQIMMKNLSSFGLSDLREIIQNLLSSETHYLEDQLIRLNQRKNTFAVLLAAAHGDPYQATDKLSKQSIHATLKILIQDGYLRNHAGKYQLTDPLLSLYLRDESLAIY